MKNVILLSLVFIVNHSIAQNTVNLEAIIPNTASMVVKLNGKALTQKVGMKNIAKSEAFLKLIEGEVFLGNSKKRITDIGINLEKDVYMIYKASRNITYTAYLYHIEKPKLFGKYIAEKNEFVETQKTDKYSVIFYKASDYYGSNDVTQDFLAWNNSYAIYVDVNYVNDRPVVEEEESVDIQSIYYNQIEDATEAVDAAAGAVDAAVDASDNEQTTEYYQEQEARRTARRKTQDSLKTVKKLEKIAIVRGHYALELNHYFGERADSSTILKNESYINSKNDNSDLSFWMNLYGNSVITQSYYDYGYYGRRNNFPGMLGMYLGAYAGKDVNGHLFFNQNDITVKSNIEFMPKLSELLQGVYSTSIPKSYLKYINTEKVMGVTSASINAAKFWEAFPSIYADLITFGMRNFPDEKERAGINVLVDFISIMMDEEAMGKLMTGSSVFVLKDLVPTEVEYIEYEYNEDFSESKKVMKTKTEVFPDFLLMFGSENKDFMTKLLDFACKNEVLYRNGNYYYSNGKSRDFPFQIYFAVTDDMAFISTNENEIKNLAEGKSVGNLDRKIATNILKNSSYFNLNLPELLSKIPKEQLSEKELQMLTYFTDNGGEIEWFNNYKDGQSQGLMQMNTPSKFKNSALFIWDLLETVHEIETERDKARAKTRGKGGNDVIKDVKVEDPAESHGTEMKCEEGKCDGGK